MVGIGWESIWLKTTRCREWENYWTAPLRFERFPTSFSCKSFYRSRSQRDVWRGWIWGVIWCKPNNQTKHFDFFTELQLSFGHSSCGPTSLFFPHSSASPAISSVFNHRITIRSAIRNWFSPFPAMSNTKQYRIARFFVFGLELELSSAWALKLPITVPITMLKHEVRLTGNSFHCEQSDWSANVPVGGRVRVKYSSRLRTNDNPSSMRLIISSENLQMELEKIISLMSDVTTYRRTCADVRLPYDLKQ